MRRSFCRPCRRNSFEFEPPYLAGQVVVADWPPVIGIDSVSLGYWQTIGRADGQTDGRSDSRTVGLTDGRMGEDERSDKRAEKLLCLFVRPFVRAHPSVCQAVRPSVRPPVRLTVRPTDRLPIPKWDKVNASPGSCAPVRFRRQAQAYSLQVESDKRFRLEGSPRLSAKQVYNTSATVSVACLLGFHTKIKLSTQTRRFPLHVCLMSFFVLFTFVLHRH